MSFTYPYTAQYKEGTEYVGAWRGWYADQITGQPTQVIQPLTLTQQNLLMDELREISAYNKFPGQYIVQPYSVADLEEAYDAAGGQWFPWLDDFLAGLQRGLDATAQGTSDFLTGQTGAGFWSGLQQVGMFGIVGLGLIALIMVIKR